MKKVLDRHESLPDPVPVKRLAVEMVERWPSIGEGELTDRVTAMQRRLYRAIADNRLASVRVIGMIYIPRAAALQVLNGEEKPWHG